MKTVKREMAVLIQSLNAGGLRVEEHYMQFILDMVDLVNEKKAGISIADINCQKLESYGVHGVDAGFK